MREPTRVTIVHQTDLDGPVSGGIDSVIRGIVKWAPDDLRMRVVGLTTDPAARPVGRWTEVALGAARVPFLPVGLDPSAMVRKGVPLSVKMAWASVRRRSAILDGTDVLEFHRLEPALSLLGTPHGKNTIIHQNMAMLANRNADTAWKRAAGLYFALERRFLHGMDSVFCVRSDAVDDYRLRFPDIASRFQFLPTWMDTDLFRLPLPGERERLRGELLQGHGLPATSRLLVAVGRLDHQKNPLLLLEAFALVAAAQPDARLLMVGEGVLRKEVEARIARPDLVGRVVLAGLQPPAAVAGLLRASDLYVMSSAYEGMPISVLEAMACGLPVASTAVGEVPRVVRDGDSGTLVHEHTPAALSQAVLGLLSLPREPMSTQAAQAVSPFTPQRVLAPVYDAYRAAARRAAQRRGGKALASGSTGDTSA